MSIDGYRLFIAPDSGPITAVKIDPSRIAIAENQMNNGVAEIITQIKADQACKGLLLNDPRAAANLSNILNHVIRRLDYIAGLVVYIPGSLPGSTSNNSNGSNGNGDQQATEELQRLTSVLKQERRKHEDETTALIEEYEDKLAQSEADYRKHIQGEQQQTNRIANERDNANAKVATLEEKIARQEQETTAGKQKLIEKIQELQATILQLEMEIKKKDDEITKLQAQVNEAKAAAAFDLTGLREQLRNVQTENKRLNDKLKQYAVTIPAPYTQTGPDGLDPTRL